MKTFNWRHGLRAGLRLLLSLSVLSILSLPLYAQNSQDFDAYKLRIKGFWFYSNPTGDFEGSNGSGTIDLQKDLAFNSYSSVSGKVDWKFTRKNHFYVAGGSFDQSRQVVLQRTIVFQGQTFETGLSVRAELSAPLIAPGYQYDIIRRKRGHLGLGIQTDFFNTSASISAAAQVTGGGIHYDAVSAKGSLLVPIPVAGPDIRFYLTDSPRVFVEGNLYGMYLFGYGNFVSTADDIGFTVTKHLSVNAGYQLASRLVVKNDSSSNRIGIHLTQKGAIVGLTASF